MEWEHFRASSQTEAVESVLLLDYKMDYDMKSDNYSTFCL